MYVWNASWNDGNAVNLAHMNSLSVIGTGSTWGIQGQADGGAVTIAPNGTYSTKTAAVEALLALLQQAGYVDVP